MHVKLSLLDYIINTSHIYKTMNLTADFSSLESLAFDKKSRFVIRNQALIVLIRLFPSLRLEYISNLISNIKKTKDYRVHIRLYTSLMNNNLFELFSSKDIAQLVEITNSMNLGKAVNLILEEFNYMMKITDKV